MSCGSGGCSGGWCGGCGLIVVSGCCGARSAILPKIITVLTRCSSIVFELIQKIMSVISPGGDFSELI